MLNLIIKIIKIMHFGTFSVIYSRDKNGIIWFQIHKNYLLSKKKVEVNNTIALNSIMFWPVFIVLMHIQTLNVLITFSPPNQT